MFILRKMKEKINSIRKTQKLVDDIYRGCSSKVVDAINADVNARTILGNVALIEACAVENEELVESLLKAKANVNASDILGKTPLMIACEKGNENIVRLLKKYGADINEKDVWGNTPLIIACSQRWTEKIARLLIKYGADVNAKNKFGKTALRNAYKNGMRALEEELIAKGAKAEEAGISLEEAYINCDEPMTMALIEQCEDFNKILKDVSKEGKSFLFKKVLRRHLVKNEGEDLNEKLKEICNAEKSFLFKEALKKYLKKSVSKLNISVANACGASIVSNDKHFMEACKELTRIDECLEKTEKLIKESGKSGDMQLRGKFIRELKDCRDDISQQTVNLIFVSRHMSKIADVQKSGMGIGLTRIKAKPSKGKQSNRLR